MVMQKERKKQGREHLPKIAQDHLGSEYPSRENLTGGQDWRKFMEEKFWFLPGNR